MDKDTWKNIARSGRHRGLFSGPGVDSDHVNFNDDNSLDDGKRFSSRYATSGNKISLINIY